MEMKTKQNSRHTLMLFCFMLSSIFVLPAFSDGNELLNVLKPQRDTNPRNLIFFADEKGVNNIAYQYQHENSPNEIYFMKNSNAETWSAPINFDLKAWSNIYLCDIKNLSDKTPCMLLLGDRPDDYLKNFNLDLDSINGIEDLLTALDMSEDELTVMIQNFQQLFYSFQMNGSWEGPFPIRDTYGASKAVLTAGSSGNALTVFFRDNDKKLETIDDVELYATVYNQGAWSEKAIRLTNNNKADYGVQAAFLQDRYVIVWVSDEDNNMETSNDKLLNYAIVGLDGRVLVPGTTLLSDYQTNPVPVLGKFRDKLVLLWSSATISASDPRRIIWQMEYKNNIWSLDRVQNTGLLNYQMGSGSVHEIGNNLIFIYQEAGALQAAVNDGEGWFAGSPLINLNLLQLNSSGVAYAPDDTGHLNIGLTGYIPGKEKNSAVKEFDGIYYTKCNLKCDLMMYDIDATPHKKQIGQDITLQFKVHNAGYYKSGSYKVLIKESQNLLKELEGKGLAAGQDQAFEYKVKMTKATMNFELEIVCPSGDGNQDNNKQSFPVKILPDYTVRSVTYESAGKIVARVVEEKNIAAPGVTVDFYAVINGESQKIGSSTYDPIADNPVGITWTKPSSLTGPFQLIAEVNHERNIIEDDYSNNKGSYIYNPLPDFVIENLTTAINTVSVTLKNKGEKPVSKIDFLVTDNPEIVVAQDINQPIENSKLYYYQEVTLDQNQSAKININCSNLKELEDKLIYAIVNPTGSVPESDQNNNMAKTLVKLRPSLPTGKRQLVFGAVYGFASSLTVTLVNTSNDPAMIPRVEVVDGQGYVINQQVVPVVKAHGWEKAVFNKVTPGKYTIRLLTNWMGDAPDILETTVTVQ